MSHPDPHNDPDNTHPVRKFAAKMKPADRYGNPLSSNRLSGAEKDVLRKKHGTNHLTGSMMDEGRSAKSKALKKRTDGKVSAVDADKKFNGMAKRFYKNIKK